jgi:hypothetical protein
LALSLAGWKLHYDAELVFEHFLPRKRLLEAYLLEMYYGFGYSSALQDVYLEFLPNGSFRAGLSSSATTLRWAIALGKVILFGIRGRAPRCQRHDRLEARVAASYAVGRARGLIETRAQAAALRSEIARWLAEYKRSLLNQSES